MKFAAKDLKEHLKPYSKKHPKMIKEPLSQEKKEMKCIDKLEKMHKKYK
jgi:hypothetical protein